LQLTLHPLHTNGRSALLPDASAGIIYIALTELGLLWHNAFNEEIIIKADDLFACAANNGRYCDPIPKGADVVRARFDIQFEESPGPCWMEIIPPHTLTLQDPHDAPRILMLLARRGFRICQNLILALILTSAAFAPANSFADDSDDDSEGEQLVRHHN
jgi:hypothetical protein